MKNNTVRNRVFLYVFIGVLTVALVFLILFLSQPKESGKQAIATVSSGSISSKLSSTGTVKKMATSESVPLAAYLDDVESLEELATGRKKITVADFFYAETAGITYLYEVTEVNEDYRNETKDFTTTDESVDLITLVPLKIDWVNFGKDQSVNVDDPISLQEYLLRFTQAEIPVENLAFLFRDYLSIDTEKEPVVVNTALLSDMIAKEISYAKSVSYSVSDISVEAGDRVLINSDLLKLTYSEWYTVFTLSEYDVPFISTRLQKDQRVYAAVGINALNGKKLIAEITKLASSGNSAGVSYFAVSARLVFPEVTAEETAGEEPAEVGSYTYYDDFLDDQTVKNDLHVDLKENVTKDDLLEGYSCTITAQKTVLENQLIVATKCIYYDDSKNPYLVCVDSEGKDHRVYIKIVLSTGTDAAVVAEEGYDLKVGDNIRYTTDSTLLSTLF